MQDLKIRKFGKQDREEVRNIAYDTALMGEPASAFLEGKDVFCDALTLYFTDYEPQSCFVAEIGGKIAGYLTGAKNKIHEEEVFSRKILPKLACKILFKGILFKKKNLAFIYHLLLSMIRGEFKMPDFFKEYPATLHINVRKEYRGLDAGKQLIGAYIAYLKKEEGIPGVCLATMSSGGGDFFYKQGFQLLFSGKRSYFRHLLNMDVPFYVYGKTL